MRLGKVRAFHAYFGRARWDFADARLEYPDSAAFCDALLEFLLGLAIGINIHLTPP
jgi:hypothetical protein